MARGMDRHHSRTTDIDDHAAALAGWEQCYIQLDRGPFAGELTHVAMPGAAVFVETTNLKLRQDIVPPAGSVVLGFLQPGSAPALFRGQPVEAGDAIWLAGGQASEFFCRSRMEVSAVVLEREVLAAEPDLPPVCASEGGGVVAGPLAAEIGAWIVALVGDLAAVAPVVNVEVLAAGLPALLASRCLRVLQGESGPDRGLAPGQRYRLVREARAMVEAAEGDVPAVPAIARRLGVSVRTLEYCFAETVGLSPTHYIRNVRLNGARRLLKSARPGSVTVADAAMTWGFWHLGRFSTGYRELFGESPSETVRRAGPRNG